MPEQKVVLDTNVFVAAGFHPGSHSARIVAAVREGRFRMVWNDATRDEIEFILRKIPHISWEDFADLFREANRFTGIADPDRFELIPDPADRPFAALAEAAGATLVTSDDHLLAARYTVGFRIVTPGEFEDVSRESPPA